MEERVRTSRSLVCENCGGTLTLAEGGGRAVCPYCGRVYAFGQAEETGVKGLSGIAAGFVRRAGIVASNFGLAQARTAADSFMGDGRDEEQRLFASAEIDGGVLKRFRARTAGESVRIPNEVSAVGKRACYKDRLLGKLSAAPQVRTFGKKCFAKCTLLTNVRLEGAQTLASRAFFGCAALREVTFARPVPFIGKKVFAKCRSLSRVFLPRSMEPQISRLFGKLAKFRIEFVYFD